MKRLTRLARIDGVDVKIHWSTIALGALILVGGWPNIASSVVVIGAYLSIVMIHEWGHVLAARRRRCTVWSIELYPLVGLTRFSAPASFFDECSIAWGGVLAQVAVATPLLIGAALFRPLSPVANAVVGIFGYFSLVIAAINLLPAPRLDGAKAWRLVPMLIARGIGAYLRRAERPIKRSRKKTWVH